MGALFGALTSLFIGLSDLFLVKTAGRSHTITVTILAFVSAAATALVGIVVFGGEPIGRDLLIGVGAGVFMGLGLVTYFQGMQVSSVGVVAPLIALQVALWPLGYDVLDGARPAPLVWCGLGVSIASLLTSAFPVQERASVQGAADFTMVASGATGGLLSGAIVEATSYHALSHWAAVLALALVAAALYPTVTTIRSSTSTTA